MIKSLLHFNNPNDLTKDEVSGVPWTVNDTVASSQDGKFGNCLSPNGNGYLQNNTIDLSLDKEWTLDMWVYADSYYGSQPVFSISSGESPSRGILIEVGASSVDVSSVSNIGFSTDGVGVSVLDSVPTVEAAVGTSSIVRGSLPASTISIHF